MGDSTKTAVLGPLVNRQDGTLSSGPLPIPGMPLDLLWRVMMSGAVETVYVDSRNVACDGGAGPLGHPRVYLAIDKTDQVVCPYCSKRFVHDPAKAPKQG